MKLQLLILSTSLALTPSLSLAKDKEFNLIDFAMQLYDVAAENIGEKERSMIIEGVQRLPELLKQLLPDLRKMHVDFYANHYDQINWINYNYNNDTPASERILKQIATDYTHQLDNFMESYIRRLKGSDLDIGFLKHALLRQILVQAFMVPLRENAMIQSAVHKHLNK